MSPRARRPAVRAQDTFWIDSVIGARYGPQLGPDGLALYLALARRVNARAECWPSYDELALETGMSKRHAIATMKVLVALELVEVQRRSRARPQAGHRNTFVLLDPLDEGSTDPGRGEEE